MAAAAAAAEKEQVDILQARRFVLPDFDRYGVWLLGRMKERFPSVPDRLGLGWLRGITQSNEHLFVTNERAVLLADQVHTQLNPVPIVREIFCFCQDGQMQHGANLYADMKRWAVSLGASELAVLRGASDVPQPMLEEVIGIKLQSKRIYSARLHD